MISTRTLKVALLASAAALTLGACSDTTIASPGNTTVSPPPPPPPPPPASASIDLVPSSGCYTGTSQITLAESGDLGDVDVCALTGTITANTTIPADAVVAISGNTQIGEDGGTSATLTIEPGAVLFGSSGADFLVINRGSQIDAVGGSTDPIIMTARADILNSATADSGSAAVGRITDATVRGQWGGLILNGLAPINACDEATATGGTADCVKAGEGSTGTFGGADPADDSGELRYLQLRYAGFEITPRNELNGIAFQGTGSGTEVNYIQVYNNADDGVEFFGGTTNAKYIALNGNADDSLDYTDGWTGNVQYVLIDHAADDADQGFEFDNNGDDNLALPRSNPFISNFTIVGKEGGDSDVGMLIREGTAGKIVNGIVTGGWSEGALDVDGTETFARIGATGAAGDEVLELASIILDDDVPYIEEAGDAVDLSTTFGASVNIFAENATLIDDFFPGTREGTVSVYNANGDDTFFDIVDSIGAFQTTETAASNWATGWTFNLVEDGTVSSCPEGTTATGETLNGQSVCELTGVNRTDVELSPGVLYELVGNTQIGADVGADGAGGDPAVLTINPGVTIFGSSGADFLVINRGSQIRANGTEDDPIIMTSRADIEGTATTASRGQWGGLILNGRAPINACDEATAVGGTNDCVKAGEGSTGEFGGDLATDNSGNLFYVQVKHAGFEITPKNELNGIAFQGVGSNTDVDFIQVYNNSDDGVEFFGGTVNASHLVLTGNSDDSIDWTDGWVGSLQFAIVQHSADAGDQGIEADNNGDDNVAEPYSDPTLSNVTLIGFDGGTSDIGALIREGTKVTLVNTVIADFNDGGIDIDQTATFDNITAGDVVIESVFLDNPGPNFIEETGDAVDLSTTFTTNVVEGTAVFTGSSLVAGSRGLIPGTAISGVTAFDATSVGLVAADYVGAVEDATDTWFEGWTFSE